MLWYSLKDSLPLSIRPSAVRLTNEETNAKEVQNDNQLLTRRRRARYAVLRTAKQTGNGRQDMKGPMTTLDTRFSDPGAVATEWEETRRILETAELFWISTVRPDGRPHVTPLVAVWLDEAIHFCTGATEQKAVNLSRNPHVILTTGCNHWNTGIDVVV